MSGTAICRRRLLIERVEGLDRHRGAPLLFFAHGVGTLTMRTVDLTPSQIHDLKRVGLWWSDYEPELPHPREYVDQAWDPSEHDLAITYLERCYYLTRIACGYSWCRFGCEPMGGMGHGEYTDGVWLFPEGFLHYVRHQAMKPPADFLEHMRKMNFRVL